MKCQNQKTISRIFFFLVSYSYTQRDLNPQPHSPPILIWVPFGPKNIGNFQTNKNFQTIFWLKSDPTTVTNYPSTDKLQENSSHRVDRKKNTKGKSYNFLKISMKIISRSIKSQDHILCLMSWIAYQLTLKSCKKKPECVILSPWISNIYNCLILKPKERTSNNFVLITSITRIQPCKINAKYGKIMNSGQ